LQPIQLSREGGLKDGWAENQSSLEQLQLLVRLLLIRRQMGLWKMVEAEKEQIGLG
jgi:hypothetical protein